MNSLIQAQEMEEVLYALFLKNSFPDKKARLLAHVHTESTLYGVNSHGIDRVPLFIDQVKKGIIKINAKAKKVEKFGNIERWDGRLGSGVINATKCTNRAIKLAQKKGMALVALRNTNHWMRGGTYGWQAANKGCIGIHFTNTQPNMPPWGGADSRIGNNPVVIAIPRRDGHVVLDMALSQFSFGKINTYKLKSENLPYPGGWDDQNQLSKDPEKILSKERGLPIGYWKGSALSMILDMLATLLSAGNSTYKVGLKKYETGLSQIFICIYPELFHDHKLSDKLLNEIINYTKNVPVMVPGNKIYYPGERALANKIQNSKNGMEVITEVWEKVLSLLD